MKYFVNYTKASSVKQPRSLATQALLVPILTLITALIFFHSPAWAEEYNPSCPYGSGNYGNGSCAGATTTNPTSSPDNSSTTPSSPQPISSSPATPASSSGNTNPNGPNKNNNSNFPGWLLAGGAALASIALLSYALVHRAHRKNLESL